MSEEQPNGGQPTPELDPSHKLIAQTLAEGMGTNVSPDEAFQQALVDQYGKTGAEEVKAKMSKMQNEANSRVSGTPLEKKTA